VTRDRFCIVVESIDPLFDEGLVREVFHALNAVHIERIVEKDDES
jgi:hypothetical protein